MESKDKPESAKDQRELVVEAEKDPEQLKISFKCSVCKIVSASCEYFGKRPPFARKYQVGEESYIMKDPFCPPPTSREPNPEHFLIVGVNCTLCGVPVCKSDECSFHYSRTFCSKCAIENIKQFPLEIQSRIRKQLAK